MNRLPLSSGDLVADRRVDYAEMLRAGGDVAAAADLMRDALSLVPWWSAGWFRMGEMLQDAGRVAEAVDAWREALRLDPEDRLGAALKLELAGAIDVAGSVTSAFARALFDQYADTFDTSLVEKLGYRVPDLIATSIERLGRESFAHAVDLGCGTGLMGARLRGMTSFLEGSDISAGMLAKARAKGIYDRLEQADLLSLQPNATGIDLVVAADVFIYLGRLENVLGTVSAMLAPGGLFAFSTEAHDGPGDLVLRESRRYAHSEAYLRGLLAACGLEVLSFDRETLRNDRAAPVAGFVVVARRGHAAGEATAMLPAEPQEEVLQPILH